MSVMESASFICRITVLPSAFMLFAGIEIIMPSVVFIVVSLSVFMVKSCSVRLPALRYWVIKLVTGLQPKVMAVIKAKGSIYFFIPWVLLQSYGRMSIVDSPLSMEEKKQKDVHGRLSIVHSRKKANGLVANVGKFNNGFTVQASVASKA